MVHDITLDKAYLLALSVEAILYGAYAILFGLCVYLLFKRGARGAVNKPFLITAILAFTLNTGHIIVGIIRALQAFSDEGSSAIDYYNQSWLPLDIFRQVLMVTTTLVADIMVTYRCYLVWCCQWKVIVAPVILLVASSIAAFVSVYNFSQLKPGQPFLNSTNVNWGYASFILWLVTIVLITSLIVYRLRYIAQQTSEFLGEEHGNRYNYLVKVILESGIVYACSVLVLVILCIVRSVYQVIAFDAIAQITGITATLIIVRVGLGTITEGMPTDEHGSAIHTGRGRHRRVSIFNIHTSGSELGTMGPCESTSRVEDKAV
ncbi:hypothetical protein M378DRAFT_309146 [Amanita muscaria Koide BX008]|uniref:Uncharacterized protein n=1 Tax=Amanita muscaria (strain Koide BX008) TaxID=946122 RepID=A0A0C2S7C4_AMAMK|nr:hypothetical protein M378DRAFT_309146 [Amanita muscaria Koide BX008]